MKKEKRFSSKFIFGAVVFALAAVVFVILLAVGAGMKDDLFDQNAAERWDENGNAYQLTLFFDNNAKVDNLDIRTFEHDFAVSLDSTLGENSEMSLDKDNEDASYYASAYMAEGKLSLRTETGSLDNVKTYAVYGDYDVFHPVDMISGSFLYSDDAHSDGIVIDEDTAWALFGSYDVVGQPIDVNGVQLYVKGVYREGRDKYEETAKGYNSFVNVTVTESGSVNSEASRSLVYISMAALENIIGAAPGIMCYEFVSVAPSEVFINDAMAKSFSKYISHMELVKNTSRFGVPNLYRILKSSSFRSMHITDIVYPYFENVARAYEDILSGFLLVEGICLFVIVVFAVIFIVVRWRNRKIRWPQIKDKFERMVEKARMSGKKEKTKWEHF